MIVSRRSLLMATPSEQIMRAAGRAASDTGRNAIAGKLAAARFAKLTGMAQAQ